MTVPLYPILNGATADSDGYFEIPGNLTGTFFASSPAIEFIVTDSKIPYIYQVASSTFTGGNTRVFPPGSPLIPAPNGGTYINLYVGAYSLARTDPLNAPILVAAGDINETDTSLRLPGRAYVPYGQAINESLIRLCENFASAGSPQTMPDPNVFPGTPLEGQIWFNNAPDIKNLFVYRFGPGSPSIGDWTAINALGVYLGDILDVDTLVSPAKGGTPSVGEAIVWDGAQWTNQFPTSGGGVDYDEVIVGGSPPSVVINTTNVTTVALSGGKARQQVFRNGVLQREGATGNYTVTGLNQITFAGGILVSGDEILIYEL